VPFGHATYVPSLLASLKRHGDQVRALASSDSDVCSAPGAEQKQIWLPCGVEAPAMALDVASGSESGSPLTHQHAQPDSDLEAADVALAFSGA
jgi:hypothetical protein